MWVDTYITPPTPNKPTSNQHQQEGLRLSIEVFDGDFSLYSAEGPIKVRMRVGFVGMYV